LETKQVLFALFRAARFGELKYLHEEKPGYSSTIEATYDQDKSIQATFTKTEFGFEITIISPITSASFIINQEGYLKSL